MNYFVIAVYLLLGLFVTVLEGNEVCRDDDNYVTAICSDNEYCCNILLNKDRVNATAIQPFSKSSALTIWQLAAIGVGGFVVVCVLVIIIVAIVMKCKNKNKVSQVNGQVTTVPPYNDPPPSYSMNNESFQNTIGSQPPQYVALNEEKKPL